MQKINPFLWFDDNAEEATAFYTSVFTNSKMKGMMRPNPNAPVLTVNFELEGQEFIALNGGPQYRFTPAASLFVQCETNDEIDSLWEKFSDGGMALMEIGQYPFSEKFGWIQDKFGLSWQLNLQSDSTPKQKITPLLMYVGAQNGKAEEAVKFYTSIFQNSDIDYLARYEPGEGGTDGTVKHGRFSLENLQFMAMDSSAAHQFNFTEAFSLFINCETQPEIDFFWEKLSEGGEESRCGWLKDKFGVSWQVVPTKMLKLLGDKNQVKANNVMQAMMKMTKLELPLLQEAYDRE